MPMKHLATLKPCRASPNRRVRCQFEETVSLHLRLVVPVETCLSGDLDSRVLLQAVVDKPTGKQNLRAVLLLNYPHCREVLRFEWA
jgi:hypothetical protein